MKRAVVFALAVAVVVAVGPGSASAAKWRGVVVGKDLSRKAVVTSSRGTMRTLRASGRFAGLKVGHRVAVRGTRLADGTFRATGLRKLGRADVVRMHVTVVKQQGRMGRTIVSAGGTILSLRGGSHHEPGDELDCLVRMKPNGKLKAIACDAVGQAATLELEGIFLDESGGVIRLAVLHHGLVLVNVPDGVDLPAYEAGDLIELVVTVEPDGSFTLVASQQDEGEQGDGDGVEHGEDGLTVWGALVSIDGGIVEVDPGEGATGVVCNVLDGADLSGFSPGDAVRMRCRYEEDGSLTLVRLRSESALYEPGGDGDQVEPGDDDSADQGDDSGDSESSV